MKRYGGCVAAILLVATGCATTGGTASGKRRGPSHARSEKVVQRAAFTLDDNPTVRAGRGTPDLQDAFRPAAWIYIDDHEGRFVERDGNPQVQWVIDEPVRPEPTFRVQALPDLLGNPTNFACTLDSLDTVDGSKVAYAIKAEDGTFQVGRAYSLLHPGTNFVIRNRTTGDVVSQIGPLPAGTYLIAAKVENGKTGRAGLAITHFTVSEQP
ncbi:MAG: hypothetical protein D6788_06155 [Planctomycetota bacterium]|nr:MAG: hypothetical protein D6788_06155 [Planctomycetota bacterium]